MGDIDSLNNDASEKLPEETRIVAGETKKVISAAKAAIGNRVAALMEFRQNSMSDIAHLVGIGTSKSHSESKVRGPEISELRVGDCPSTGAGGARKGPATNSPGKTRKGGIGFDPPPPGSRSMDSEKRGMREEDAKTEDAES